MNKNNSQAPVIAVGGLVFNCNGDILLLKTHKWGGRYSIPAGKVEYRETLENALIREVMEETNLSIDNIRFFMNQEIIEDERFFKKAHFVSVNFTCRALTKNVKLNEESQDFIWTSPWKALEFDLNDPTRELISKWLDSGDRIMIKDLTIECIVGVNKDERERTQKIGVTAEISANTRKAAASGQLDDTIDYYDLSESLIELAKTNNYFLIETMAEDMAALILKYTKAFKVRIRIEKPAAIPNAHCAAVDITRRQSR